MSVELTESGVQFTFEKGIHDPKRELYNTVIRCVANNKFLALKDVLEKGRQERGHSAINQVLNSLDFAPPEELRTKDPGGLPVPSVSLPLMFSCMFALDNCTATLLEYGADPNMADESDIFPLVLAAEAYKRDRTFSSLRAIRLLLQHGANVDTTTSWKGGQTVLLWYCQVGAYDVVKLLLLHGADIFKETPDGSTSLQAIQCCQNVEIMKLLVERRAHYNARQQEQILAAVSTILKLDEGSLPRSSSAASQPQSSCKQAAAAHPGPSTPAAKTANETPTSSSSSAAAQPGQHPAVKACLWCGATRKHLKRCGGCGAAWLCGAECQQHAWPSHRSVCREVQRKARAERRTEDKQQS